MEQQKHSYYMGLAIKEAELAAAAGEIPVGCVIVKDGEVIAFGHNTRETAQTALGHAEINAIQAACAVLKSWRLCDCTLYVTLEPCPMCMGAILNARLSLLVFGATDFRAGCCGGLIDFNSQNFPNSVPYLASISEDACQELLKRFFSNLR